jgi:hypothetical protein
MPVANRRRWLTVLAAVALLALMVAVSRDFGATWDERALQKYSEQIWDYYTGRTPRSAIDLSFGYIRIYGGFVEFLDAAAQHLIPADVYVVRHMVNAAFGWVGVVFAFLIGARLFGTRAAWLAGLLLIIMPRYFGESMNNPKDLPFAVLMFVAAYYILTLKPEYPYFSWIHGLKLALAIALALDVRAMGLVLVGYAGLGLLIAVLASGERSTSRLIATAGRFAAVAMLGIVGSAAFWPWAQESPLVRPIQAFFVASGFNWGNPSLFAGRDIAAVDLPWYYLPTWLAITLPPVVILGVCFSLMRIVQRSENRVQLLGLWALVLIPGIAAIVRHVTMYDGIRHMFFIVPPIAVIAAAGWDHLITTLPRRTVAIAAGLLAVGVAEPVVYQIRNHPNQNVYFSPAIGGPRAAFGQYEMDYWGNCVLQTVRWSAEQARVAQMPLGVAGNAWEIVAADTLRFPELWFRQRNTDSYHFDIRLLKGQRQAVLDTSASPDVIYRVTTRDGASLCVVMPGPLYPRFQERLAQVSPPSSQGKQ